MINDNRKRVGEIMQQINEGLSEICTEKCDNGKIYSYEIPVGILVGEIVYFYYSSSSNFAEQALIELLQNEIGEVRFWAYYHLSAYRHKLNKNIICELNCFMDNPENSAIVRQASEQYHVPLN